MEGTGLVEIHDLLVAEKRPETEHGPANCGICAERAGVAPPKEETAVTTYTEDQLNAKVAEATAGLQAQLDELRQAATAGEIDEKIAAERKPLEDKIAELESAADVLTAQLNEVTAERDKLVQDNTEREQAEQEKAERDERKADRVARIGEVAKFTDEQVAERADKWADMDDASFDTLVEDLKAHATPPSEEPVRRSPLTAAEERKTPAGKGLSSDLTTAMGFRRQGIKHV